MDLVPTISMLFGIPIPFHSLGCFLPDFTLDQFNTSLEYIENVAYAAFMNLNQIKKFLFEV